MGPVEPGSVSCLRGGWKAGERSRSERTSRASRGLIGSGGRPGAGCGRGRAGLDGRRCGRGLGIGPVSSHTTLERAEHPLNRRADRHEAAVCSLDFRPLRSVTVERARLGAPAEGRARCCRPPHAAAPASRRKPQRRRRLLPRQALCPARQPALHRPHPASPGGPSRPAPGDRGRGALAGGAGSPRRQPAEPAAGGARRRGRAR